jgi:serine/threonine-protein kinase HipA
MTSETPPREAFVWIWLPGREEPVVAGRLSAGASGRIAFTYGRSYLERDDAIAIYEPELPLRRGAQEPEGMLTMPGCVRDASPDAWGRRVILNKLTARRGANADPDDLDEITYLLRSGSDRIGALDFQGSATDYIPRLAGDATMTELLEAVDRVEAGIPLSPNLADVLDHGTSIGGARPKALIQDGARDLIAKFSSSTDTNSVVKAEFVAMRLASRAGLNVAPVRIVKVAGRDVLLVERFDRVPGLGGKRRRALVSALTILALDEMAARHASYEDLATEIRRRFTRPRLTLRELFSRIVFNILSGNTDDHARNHAAFWDGDSLELTPAYDICPQFRTGREATQAMLIQGNDRSSRLSTCIAAAPAFLLEEQEAIQIMKDQVAVVGREWNAVCDEANLSEVDRRLLRERAFLNPFAFEGLPEAASRIGELLPRIGA